jgi:uncharacterized protein (DUF433 family)
MATRSYVQVTVEEVAELYYQGYNFSQIARELGCARNTVRAKIMQYVAKTGRHIYISGKPYKEGYAPQDICDMYDDGWSVAEIAEDSGFSQSYIYKVLKGYTDASR